MDAKGICDTSLGVHSSKYRVTFASHDCNTQRMETISTYKSDPSCAYAALEADRHVFPG